MIIDDAGWPKAEDGEGISVITMPRKGLVQLPSGTPRLGINHTYGMFVGEGKDNPKQDGTVGCATRFSNGSAKYGPQDYMSRGTLEPGFPGADLYVMAPCHLRTYHCEGRVKLPGENFRDAKGNLYLNNDCGLGVEWAGTGFLRLDGTDWTGPKGRKIWNGKVYNLSRPDFIQVGKFVWQKPTDAQVYTAQRFWAAARERYDTLKPEDCIHGHEEMGSGGHMCPGPAELAALKNQVLPYLTRELVPTKLDDYHYAEYHEMFSEDALFSIDPSDWWAQMGGRCTVDEAEAQFSIGELDLLFKEGYITHDDPQTMTCNPDVFVWVGPQSVQP